MTDPILYLSMLLGLGGIYVLISSFHDDDDGDDDGGDPGGPAAGVPVVPAAPPGQRSLLNFVRSGNS